MRLQASSKSKFRKKVGGRGGFLVLIRETIALGTLEATKGAGLNNSKIEKDRGALLSRGAKLNRLKISTCRRRQQAEATSVGDSGASGEGEGSHLEGVTHASILV